MRRPVIIPPALDGVTVNFAQGLRGLVDRGVQHVAQRSPGYEVAAKALGDVVKEAIRRNPGIVDRDITAVEIAEHIGILPRRRGRR